MTNAQSDVVELTLDPEKLDEIDAIGRATSRDRQGVVIDALSAYLELHRWQAAQIEKGLQQADAGEFATDEEIARVFRRGS